MLDLAGPWQMRDSLKGKRERERQRESEREKLKTSNILMENDHKNPIS